MGETIAEGFLTTILHQTPDWMFEAQCLNTELDPIKNPAEFTQLCLTCPVLKSCESVKNRLKNEENRTKGIIAAEYINNKIKPTK